MIRRLCIVLWKLFQRQRRPTVDRWRKLIVVHNIAITITIIIIISKSFVITRSYAALRAADLDWNVGPGYMLGRYILEKNHEKTNLEL